MNKRKYDKLLKRVTAKRDKEVRLLVFNILRKLKRSSIETKLMYTIADDVLQCNWIDLLHYLSAASFTTKQEFVYVVQSWLDHERITFEYKEDLVYGFGSLAVLSKKIRQHHLYLDLKAEIMNL